MRFPKTQVIALVNQKGGCGKTTSSVAIAAAFANLGYSACLADIDPQCNATESFGVRAESYVEAGRFTLADAFIRKRAATDIEADFEERFQGRLTILPGNRGLNSVPLKLESELQIAIADGEKTTLDADEMRGEQRLRLKRSIDALRGKKDVVVIDTPPSLDFLMVSTLIAADWFIIPVFPSGYDLKGLELLMKTVSKVRERYNPGLRLAGVLLGNYDRTATLDRDIHQLLKGKFGEEVVFNTTIGRSVRMRDATVRGMTVFELPEAQAQAQQFVALVQEMLNRGSKRKDQTVNPLPDEAVFGKVANG
ncbi:chromosome partitioning protein ParA [Bryobacterales bacterium F-183]|nr:chromosome partitioning protein ParA [Bryobacterales bacterium F-183]